MFEFLFYKLRIAATGIHSALPETNLMSRHLNFFCDSLHVAGSAFRLRFMSGVSNIY